MKNVRIKSMSRYVCAVVCFIILVSTVLGLLQNSVVFSYAGEEVKQYTDALTDLSKDKAFDISKYPEKDGSNKDDYKIDVIQVAESEDKELFVYCYIPCRTATGKDGKKVDLSPTQISLAVSTDINNMNYVLHGLREINSYRTITKYIVLGVDVDVSSPIRYYDVPMLQRKTIEGKEEAEAVGKLWTVEVNASGKTSYAERHKETIEILNPIAGAVRYHKDQVPANWGSDAVDSHFVAFDTDLPIDDLLEADISYIPIAWMSNANGKNGSVSPINEEYLTAYRKHLGTSSSLSVLMSFLIQDKLHGPIDPVVYKLPTYCSIENYTNFTYDYVRAKETKTVTIKKDDKYTFGTGGWFTEDTYKWNRIQDIKGFKSSLQDKTIVHMSGDYTVGDIEKRTWFLRYRETLWDDPDNSFEEVLDSNQYKSTRDLDIVVLRLKFETAGIVYDMGTVSNKVDQTEYIKGNTPKSFWESLLEWFEDNWYWIVAVIIIVILMIIFGPLIVLSVLWALLKLLLKGLWWFIKLLGKVLWWISSLPFRAIAALVRKIRGES